MFLIQLVAYLFSLGAVAVVAAGVIFVAGFDYIGKDLPDYQGLKTYEPPVMTRVHASDGSLMAEYSHERRLFLPIQAIPDMVKQAFISAEDKNFYEHRGIDPEGIVRAAYSHATDIVSGRKRRAQGASTITQQVAKNFFLSADYSYERKLKEWVLATRMDETYSKDKVLELYLNQIFLGIGAYGIGAASLQYFDKSVQELTIAEAAYLAALPKGPNNYHPIRNKERALDRRNYIIRLMAENGFITEEDANKAKQEPLTVTLRATGNFLFASEYFTEEVRRELGQKYGEKGLYEGGLSVRTTLDPKIQIMARKALMKGLIGYDQDQGWRGPVKHFDLVGDWGPKVADVKGLADVPEWQLAIVTQVVDAEAQIGLQPPKGFGGQIGPERDRGIIPLDQMKWAKAESGPRKGVPVKAAGQVVQPGDVVWVERVDPKANLGERTVYRLRQTPEVSGAIAVMDPHTGRVLATSGGFSYAESEFNRATQAMRQPGSSFKPFVYATALDNGYTPSSIVLDGPVEIQVGNEVWKPENYSKQFYGPSTLRIGIEQSRNTMTVRLAKDMGMPLVVEYAKRFGIYDDLKPYLPMSLGAGETTVVRMTTAYATIANGGKRVNASFIDRIQDRYGKTIFKHDERRCETCEAASWSNQSEPVLENDAEQVLDPMTAYQITSMMEGVIQRGTATVIKEVGKPIAGKTGTSNDEKDAWFLGFTPDLVVGIYMGFDKPKPMGEGRTGGHLAAPIAKDFFMEALRDKAATPFRVPPGIKLMAVNRKTGQRASPGDPDAIMEGFKPGTAPPENYNVIGYDPGDFGRAKKVTPDQERGLEQGGLY